MHRAELVGREVRAVLAQALLGVEDRSLRIELDEERDEKEERQDEHDANRCEREVHAAFREAWARKEELLPDLDAEDAAEALGRDTHRREAEQVGDDQEVGELAADAL